MKKKNDLAYYILYKTAAKNPTIFLKILPPESTRKKFIDILKSREFLIPASIIGGIIGTNLISNVLEKNKFKKALSEVSKDPFIAKYPEDKVMDYASTLYDLNPKLAGNKEILRTFLQSALAMQSIDPSFASRIAQRKRSPFETTIPLGPVLFRQLIEQVM